MGNLKQCFFIPTFEHGAKVKDKIIPLLNLSHSEVLARFSQVNPNNIQTSNIQQPYNTHTNMPYSDIAQPYEYKGLSRYQTTGSNKYELSKQGSAVTSNPLPYHLALKEKLDNMETDEWLKDLE